MSKRVRFWLSFVICGIVTLILAFGGLKVQAQEDTEDAAPVVAAEDTAATAELAATVDTLKISIDTSWVLLTGFLVFIMQLGFAILETGMIRHTAAVNA